ncbi:hypothetical protein MOVI109754_19320 [Moritella viscosa]|uniref:Uncharacterized protein n=2 Tax=Moritella viscosa TaxID=80854 RepID=A0A090I952_9GAMM|nr:membrane protein [Moritella viscosa]SGY94365.1 Putative uncharacterized protein [Moritella viscosa]SGY99872.1 Putative uncharacterized protein [Moritella viscosa]SGZ05876.1 Putative uncharacterized protein [Moritella viscosa]SHO08954.1 Putative uncharacterized protein [Moritella viscosa]
MVKVMKKRSTLIVAGLIILSAIPFSLNILINMFFSNLDTEIYEKKKARVEQRRQIEKMFPELDTTNPLRPQVTTNKAAEDK